MTILAIDTSGPVCGVALVKDGKVLAELTTQNQLTHSVNLMPMVDEALRDGECSMDSVDRIACAVGPGSFTGVRIGVSTVKGLAHGSEADCVAVDALEAISVSAGYFDGVICPIQDARAGQVYGAAFLFAGEGRPKRLMADTPMMLEDYLKTIDSLGKRFLFLGDGMPVHREAIEKCMGNRAVFACVPSSYIRPSAVAYLGVLSEETVSYTELMPLYLRAPNAEKNKRLVDAANAG
ncbi:MAG: tRNA (adenosine(37)-N6)-threonylcarbamoyltransferase complex dimerization subunit type 1 TsaB [Clostridia bacterium]|nr:tRNA (adenosine(37)-N6)-threonylcarbamoyltransferase complex dimerization subunit type 1 TsaB [Clostridia bacterium]